MKERVEKWKKYNLRLISSMENNERDKGVKDEDVKNYKKGLFPYKNRHVQTKKRKRRSRKVPIAKYL